jgi:hypothetical protein
MARRDNVSSAVALGGVLAALAVVIMCMGGLIPVATFICPAVCMMIQAVVLRRCGRRFAWAWYGAVAILSLLMGPDKEAAAVFVFLGYYPILRPWLNKLRPDWLFKGLYFNAVIAVLYTLLLKVLGFAEILEDYAEMGAVMTVAMLIMGNITFFLLDRLLSLRFGAPRQRHGR